jgi:hypothetical protein
MVVLASKMDQEDDTRRVIAGVDGVRPSIQVQGNGMYDPQI